MNEFELTIRAKQVIDNLAQGINPYNETELPDDTVLNDPRLVRCFFHISKKLTDKYLKFSEVYHK